MAGLDVESRPAAPAKPKEGRVGYNRQPISQELLETYRERIISHLVQGICFMGIIWGQWRCWTVLGKDRVGGADTNHFFHVNHVFPSRTLINISRATSR